MAKTYKSKYYAEHREKVLEKANQYAREHKAEHKEYMKEHREEQNKFQRESKKRINDKTKLSAISSYSRWTPEEDQQMLDLFAAGYKTREVAEIMMRTLGSILIRKSFILKNRSSI
jgi:hypothetical protein